MGAACRGRQDMIAGRPDVALLSGKRIALSKGCELCFPGLKAVIFVTGLCDDNCYYCPVSREKLGRDVFYVNEERVSSFHDALVEIARQGARGASITGGDPLVRFDRVAALIGLLKENFGDSFHIHLYTSGRYATTTALRYLDSVGLDEIRFHPTRPAFEERVRKAVQETSMNVGIEIPIAPGLERWAMKLIKLAESAGASFVNLNEMEFVEPNAERLLLRGYSEDPKRPHTVKGSLEAAIRVLSWAAREASIPVHFCPASFKDKVQTRNRLSRMAILDRSWHEEARGPVLIWGELRRGNQVIATAPPRRDMLASLAAQWGLEAYIVEGYPTRNRAPRVSEEKVYPPANNIEA
ncbi:MAG: radical SAM protein [Desulfurococcales archaeon]|nr:radical SAM protein [Desulfurococcales archaeon]